MHPRNARTQCPCRLLRPFCAGAVRFFNVIISYLQFIFLPLPAAVGHAWSYTRCTHSYLLLGADQPECTTCQCPLTAKHILVEYTEFGDAHNKYFIASSTQELFQTVDALNILDFIKEIHFVTSYDVVNFLKQLCSLGIIVLLILFLTCINHLFTVYTHRNWHCMALSVSNLITHSLIGMHDFHVVCC